MKAENTHRIDPWYAEARTSNIIYLRDLFPQEPIIPRRRRRKKRNGDMIWNVLFVTLCLSVLVCLFLH